MEPLIAPTILFRFEFPLRYVTWAADAALELPVEYRVPHLAELDGQASFADFRMGWSEAGIQLSVRVSGKRQQPWCRESRVEDSDGLQLLLDTRDTRDIHRASRFCHCFVLMPQGGGRRETEAVAMALPIARAKEQPAPIRGECLTARSEQRIDGYVLGATISAEALTGFDPEEHPRLGMYYVVVDRELGCQTLTLTDEYPAQSDPSLWTSVALHR